jgi:UDP-N-acetylglucosamine 2-epimerase (non-hydrolysing)
MAPLVLELERRGLFRITTCLTGQHREMLDQVMDVFGLVADHDLRVMRERQSLTHITSAVLKGIDALLDAARPDLAIVHGDTTTTFAAALASFYRQISVAHVEAGLRTDDVYNPYPEEMNRRLTDRLSRLYYAPTQSARAALIAEGVPATRILVTGNTVIDALLMTVARPSSDVGPKLARVLEKPGPKVLVTAHRRESWGVPMERVAQSIAEVCTRLREVTFILPLHLNPDIRTTFAEVLDSMDQVVFTEPLPYGTFVRVMQAVDVIMTDSGGLQEEAPSLGKPVLVMRSTTERPEGIAAGTARLVGTDPEVIVGELIRLLTDTECYGAMASAHNPYGDGRAAGRIADHLECHFGLRSSPPEEFTPQTG